MTSERASNGAGKESTTHTGLRHAFYSPREVDGRFFLSRYRLSESTRLRDLDAVAPLGFRSVQRLIRRLD